MCCFTAQRYIAMHFVLRPQNQLVLVSSSTLFLVRDRVINGAGADDNAGNNCLIICSFIFGTC
jgi:hypothetical protein